MATMNPQIPTGYDGDNKQGVLGSVPAWGSYLYSNFLLPAFSPSEWLNSNTPNPNGAGSSSQPTDYFNSQPVPAQSQPQPQPQSQFTYSQRPSNNINPNAYPYSSHQPGPSNYYNTGSFYPASSIPTSLLVSQPSSSSTISPSVDVIDATIINPSPSPISPHITPAPSPKRGAKRRASSMDSADGADVDSHDEHGLDEHDHDIAEGVERDGMIWGMKVEAYRALSARERKRVRNRISARTFRAKRKEHLSSLELDIESKDLQVKAANDEAARLRAQVAELKARLAKYERV